MTKLSLSAAIFLAALGASSAFAPLPVSKTASATALQMAAEGPDRRSFVSQTASAAAAASVAVASTGIPAPAEAAASKMWEKVPVPFEDTIYDIDFDR